MSNLQGHTHRIEMIDAHVSEAQLLLFCKATADSLRLDILRALSFDSYGVMELCRIFDMPQPGISHHLKILSSAQLLVTRREGNSIFYRRALISADEALSNLKHSLFDAVDRISLGKEIQDRIDSVYQERAAHSRAYFDKNAGKFKENQDMIVKFEQYSGCIQELLGVQKLPRSTRVLEVGPGEGELLKLLAGQFDELYAVDISAEMLARAKDQFDSDEASRIAFICGDMNTAIKANLKPDLVILNMVLHHLPSPAEAFSRAKQLISEQGYLLIVDLSSHDQNWVRENCGDLWLGFESSDLDSWANNRGLSRIQSLYLGLRNGFQIQMGLFQSQPTVTTNG
jgi:ubiquinone/menaquinone biosynthesis C-methylase UbiE/DNA-binding transcriptional ArsR family regulator